MYARPEDVLAKSDVRVQENRLINIYCAMNFAFYLGQMFTLVLMASALFSDGHLFSIGSDN